MTVKELIRDLLEYPLSAEVIVAVSGLACKVQIIATRITTEGKVVIL